MGITGRELTLFLVFIFLIGWTQGEENITKHYSSYYGIPCEEPCDAYGKSYLWCNTKSGWDYCSTKENTDYKGQACRDDHACGKYGKSYHWCYTKNDSWGYCGVLRNPAEPKTLLYMGSTYMSLCWDDCFYNEKKEYFWCHTDKGWDYCSPLPDVTYKNEPCRLDHYCGPHDSDHTWCYTNSGSDKCGTISPGECKRIIIDPMKEGSTTVMSCTWRDKKYPKEFKFNSKLDLTISPEGFTWKNEILNFIACWKNSSLNPEPSFKLITSDNLRFEVQRQANEEGQPFYNLQILVKVHAQSGRSSKLAEVHILESEEVPDRFVQQAFMESFRHRARIFVEVNELYSDSL